MPNLKDFNNKYGHVDGFMMTGDMACFDFLLSFQNSRGIVGDYFEIGVYAGKSTFFSAQFLKFGERIGLIDINDVGAVVETLRREQIAVEFHKGRSSTARYTDLYQSFAGKIRFFHIDGDHTGFASYSDLLLAADAIAERGIVIIDDFCNRNYPQLVAATYRFLLERPDFKLLLVGDNKAFIVRAEDYTFYYRPITTSIFETLERYGQHVSLRKSSYSHDMGALVIVARDSGNRNIVGRDEDIDDIPD